MLSSLPSHTGRRTIELDLIRDELSKSTRSKQLNTEVKAMTEKDVSVEKEVLTEDTQFKEESRDADARSFCDTELGRARQDRDFRFADVKKLNAELAWKRS